jgi:hypothetical protein
MPLLPSTSPYDEAARQALVDALDALLLDVLALGLICRRAERGMSDDCEAVCDLCRHLDRWAGKLGDASASLGGSPPGTAEEVAERHRIDDWPDGPADDEDVKRELADRVAQLSGWVADGAKRAGAAGAADVLVLLGKVLGKLTKLGWRISRGAAPAVDGARVQNIVPPASVASS